MAKEWIRRIGLTHNEDEDLDVMELTSLLERVANDTVNENWEFVVLELQKKAGEIAERAQAEQREADAKIAEIPSGHYNVGNHKQPYWDGPKIAKAIREAKP